jgi:uncharacterized iron-regulated membrane protein
MCWSRHYYRIDDEFADRRRPARRQHTDVVTAPASFRVSDADRQQVIDQLKRHTTEGRLTLDEFEARVDEALLARTGADLRPVLRELPPLEPSREVSSRSFVPGMWIRPAVAAAVVVALVSLVVGHLLLWPLFVVAFLWLPRSRGRHVRRQQQERSVPPDGDEEVTFV